MKAPSVTGWLLDTHALLWMLHGDQRLSRAASDVIDGDLPVFHSLVSFWEIAIKLSGKRFDFHVRADWNTCYPEALERVNVPLLVPGINDCRLVQDLPKHHADPFDRMLVSQAANRQLGIISADPALDAYSIRRIW